MRATTALGRLARLYGVQPAFVDGVGERRHASAEAVLATLRALGAPIERADDASEAARVRQRDLWRTTIEPVVVVWRGRAAACEIRDAPDRLRGRAACQLIFEEGGRRTWTADLGRRRFASRTVIDGAAMASLRLALPRGLPLGYHTLRIELDGRRHEALVIVAPVRAYDPGGRAWGAFLPTYALRTADSWGIGDLTDVERMLTWLGDLGGGMFSTLPLLAAFLGDGPFDPSPYAPASRLFWNEIYVDPRRTPEFARSRRARALAGAASFGRETAALGRARHVDYARVMRLKRRVLERLAAEVEASDDERAAAFRRFQRERPSVGRYAAFRAAGERLGKPWPEWSARPRDGVLDDMGGAQAIGARRYHAYAQWLGAEQVEALADHAFKVGPGLYLDVPIGVHPHSYDVWAHRSLFAPGVAAGAPPEACSRRDRTGAFRRFIRRRFGAIGIATSEPRSGTPRRSRARCGSTTSWGSIGCIGSRPDAPPPPVRTCTTARRSSTRS